MRPRAMHPEQAVAAQASCSAAPSGGQPAINLEVLGQLRELDPAGVNGLIGRVLATYRKSLARLMRQLAVACDCGDRGAVRLVAHTLKSSSASIGALSLSEACGAVERAVRDGQADGLPALIRRLQSEAGRADDAVRQLQEGCPSAVQ